MSWRIQKENLLQLGRSLWCAVYCFHAPPRAGGERGFSVGCLRVCVWSGTPSVLSRCWRREPSLPVSVAVRNQAEKWGFHPNEQSQNWARVTAPAVRRKKCWLVCPYSSGNKRVWLSVVRVTMLRQKLLLSVVWVGEVCRLFCFSSGLRNLCCGRG